MAQPAQITGLGPSGEWVAIDNSAAPAFPSLDASKEHIGYDNTFPGAVAQGKNSFGDTGTVLIDASGNDTVYSDPQIATFPGNPVSQTAPTYKTVTKVLTDPNSATVNWKNPA